MNARDRHRHGRLTREIELAHQNGCDYVIDYRKEDFAARVKEITKGEGCHVVYDGVGKATFPAALDCLQPLGYFVSFGLASGPIPPVDLMLLAAKGSLFATWQALPTHFASRKDVLSMSEDLFDVLASGAVKIRIHTRMRLAEAAQAHRISTLGLPFQPEHSWLMDKALEKFRGTRLVGTSAPAHLRAQLALATLVDKGHRPRTGLISACLQAGGKLVFGRTARINTEAKRGVTVLFPTALQAFKCLQYEDTKRQHRQSKSELAPAEAQTQNCDKPKGGRRGQATHQAAVTDDGARTDKSHPG
jgi:Zinc-binding dehydrogenase